MARSGEVIENPVTGERIEFREAAADSGGSVLAFDYHLRRDGFAVGRLDHVHPRQEERFEIERGELGVRIDGDEWTATAGTRFAVPSGTAHTVWNDGSEPMYARIEIRPALDLETFFETAFGLARDGATNRLGLPGPLQLAVLAHAYRREFRLAGAPGPLQRGVAAALRPIGHLAGYRARYPEYSEPAEAEPVRTEPAL